MGFTEKIDALDLIITVLKDHEKALDEKLHKLHILVVQLEGKDSDTALLKRFYEPISK